MLLAPTRIYVKALLALIERCRSSALATSPAAACRRTCRACCRRAAGRDRHRELAAAGGVRWLQAQGGNIADDEMYRTFNCGVGMVVVVAPSRRRAGHRTAGPARRKAWRIGTIEGRRAARVRMSSTPALNAQPFPVVVLISGSGSNLQAFIDGRGDGSLPARSRGDQQPADAFGLERAAQAGIPTEVLDHRDLPDREAFDRAGGLIDSTSRTWWCWPASCASSAPRSCALRAADQHPPVAAAEVPGPAHPPARAGGRASEHGASVHFVTEELDGGPVILQARVPVLPGDAPVCRRQAVLPRLPVAARNHVRLRPLHSRKLLIGLCGCGRP
jgi:phosphoribosylglycinamide formyltransferase 1